MDDYEMELWQGLDPMEYDEMDFAGLMPNFTDYMELFASHIHDMQNGTYNFTFSESDQRLQKIISYLNVYVIPIIITIGVVGNTITFLVYICTPHLSRQSSSVYLAFLAAVNNGYLVSLLFLWIGWVGIMQIMHMNGWCQTIMYCQYVCSFLSAWTVVAFTCERWIVVFHPLKRHELCTRRRAMICLACLTVFALIGFSFSTVTHGIYDVHGVDMCLPATDYQAFLRVIDFIDTVITVILPPVAIVMMNTGIGVKICRYTNKNKRAGKGSASMEEMTNISVLKTNGDSIEYSTRNATRTSVLYPNQSTRPRPWRFLTKKHHTQLRITRALLIVSSVFILLNLPHSVMRIHSFILSIKKQQFDLSLMHLSVWREFFQLLYYINFSSNFFLYSACSRNFRFALKKLLRRAKHKWRSLSNQRSIALYNMFVKRDNKTWRENKN